MTPRVPLIRTPNFLSCAPPLNSFDFLRWNATFVPHVQHGLNFWRFSGEAAEVVPNLQFRR